MTESYYDSLAPYYKYIYADWDASVTRQAQALDGVIREFCGEPPKTVLDVSCGIGTQSIGLAGLGYRVTASDLSPAAVEQARREALRYGVQIAFQVDDMRRAWDARRRRFDVVLACDNSVPHLPDDSEILLAFRQFYRCTRPGGCCLVSVRDYAALERGGQVIYPRLVRETGGGRIVLFDVWKFDGAHYEMATYLVEDTGTAEARTLVFRGGKYYCVEISTLERLFREAGFRAVHTLRERYFQPLIVALK